MHPKFLDNSPLYGVILEVRFSSKIPEDAIPGIVYSKLVTGSENSWQITPLPASQLPAQLRQQDPNLKYAPTQKLTSATQTINVGSNIISLEANNSLEGSKYPGWKEFYKQFKTLIEKLDFIEDIERIGIRYINFFQEENFLSMLNVEVNTGWESKGQMNNSSLMFFVEKNGLKSKVTISAEATIQDGAGQRIGQIIDIDTFIEGGIPREDLNTRVDEAHSLTKDIFYSLPSKSLLKKMGPSK